MNIVMDDAVEVYVKDAKPKREIGESNFYVVIGRCSRSTRSNSAKRRQHHAHTASCVNLHHGRTVVVTGRRPFPENITLLAVIILYHSGELYATNCI